MKTLFLIFMAWCVVGHAQNRSSLDSTLCAIYKNDQAIRLQLEPFIVSGNRDSLKIVVKEMHRTDSINQIIVSAILDQYGWPEEISFEADFGIFLVIDHAKIDYQRKYYPLVKQKADSGKLDKGLCATLEDRMLMYDKKKQIYGTQTIGVNKNGKRFTYIWPIEDAKRVNKRRKKVNLSTIEKYIKGMNKAGYNVEWDKSLTVKEIQEMRKTNR